MNTIIAIVLLLLAVVVGGLLVVRLNQTKQKGLIKILLAFSGGFLLAIAFAHFLPELYADHHSQIGIFVLLGFLIQLFLEYFSGGIEHGHVHHHAGQPVPWILLLSLSIHSFLEGIPLAHPEVMHHGHASEGSSLLVGIILHQIPVAIALMTLLKISNISSLKAWNLLMLFGIMTPAGLVFGILGGSSMLGNSMPYILAVVIGMFLHISTTIIFETSENHKFNLIKLTSILAGVLLALILSPI